jgi:hypothetical protein
MAGITASISVGGAQVLSPGELVGADGSDQACIFFYQPEIYLHGTREELAAFARAILGKVERADGV